MLKSNFYACIWLPAHQWALLSCCYSTFLSVWAWTTAKAQLAVSKLCSNTRLHSDWSYCFPIWKKGVLQWHQQRGCNLLVLTQNLLDGLGLTYIKGQRFPTRVQSLILLARAFKFVDHLVEKEYLLAGQFLWDSLNSWICCSVGPLWISVASGKTVY